MTSQIQELKSWLAQIQDQEKKNFGKIFISTLEKLSQKKILDQGKLFTLRINMLLLVVTQFLNYGGDQLRISNKGHPEEKDSFLWIPGVILLGIWSIAEFARWIKIKING